MAKKRIDRKTDAETGAVTFTVLETGRKIVANIADFPEAVVRRLVLHGINAKVGDSAAAPDVDAYEAIKSTYAQLVAGTWNVRGAGGVSRLTILAEAIAQIKGLDPQDVQDKIDDMDEGKVAELKKNAKVVAVMKDIRLKRAEAAAKGAKAAAATAEDFEI